LFLFDNFPVTVNFATEAIASSSEANPEEVFAVLGS
jgi:hypothetical protein